jgi:quercetin dioxygenase-like cupin family protein
MKRIVLLLGLVLLLVVSTHWVGQAQQTAAGAQAGDDPRFTGKSVTMDGKDLSAARRHFEPGARTAWHSHDNGQLLLESEYAGPNVVHWHGATLGQALVQINIGFGGDTKWMEKVTDAEYQRK